MQVANPSRLLALLLAAGVPVALPAQAAPDSMADRFDRRDVMIPMRDGVRLFTAVLTPRQRGGGALPFILTRTPYGGGDMAASPRTAAAYGQLIRDGYIFVFQDIRGRHQSEGAFVMNRPPCQQRGERCLDEATDTYDTIEWLLKNVPGNNGRVGQLGISYPGWLTNASAFGPHPALKAVSPQATMGDTWMGDDFFHQGTFRQSYGVEYAWGMEASADESEEPTPGRFDTYDWYRSFPTLDSLARAIGARAWPTWRRFVEHPAYDSVWQVRSVVRRLHHAPIPTLTVGGWWDQEDLYGPLATYRSMETTDTGSRNYLVMGPWYHGEWAREAGDSLGNARFGSNTGEYYRREIEAPWFRHWLKDGAELHLAEATLFDAGARRWRTFDHWPPEDGVMERLYFGAGGRLGFDPPAGPRGAGPRGFDEFVSDPAHPVPYRPRPVEWTYDPRGSRWRRWMTEDQRFVAGRPDVLVWQTGPLAADITIAGDITARLYASTTGTDADWVVKIIDVYPDSIADSVIADRPWMGGYQLMVAGDVMRGRYYRDWAVPHPIPANSVTRFTVDLHQQAYTFQQGHRIMVQVQSTWFPLYDRNPQTFTPNIFKARASDYRARTHRVWRTARFPSHVEVRVLPSAKGSEAHRHGAEELGPVSFPVFCNAEARRRFERAAAALYSFWWEAGERAFGSVLEADPGCAMAYWGLALNAWGNPFAGGPIGEPLARGADAARRAAALGARSPRERGFIAAAGALYRDTTASNAVRLQAYADTMARLYRDFPGDDEVAIYHALALLATAPRTDTTFATQRQAAAILNPLFARHPNHPGLAHYIIHATDSPRLAHLGLDAARRYARIAPAAPHAQHMPSHIFVRLGLWRETVAANRRSFDAGVAYARAVGLSGGTPETLHALDYAVYASLQQGRDSAARAAVAAAAGIRIPPRQGTLVGGYNRTAMAARLPLERSDWAAAAAFPLPSASGGSVTPALNRFTRAIGAARGGGPPEAALAEVRALDAIADGLAGQGETYWARVVRIKRDAAGAWVRWRIGDTTGALALARAAADSEEVTDKHPVTPAELLPARELEADLLLAAGRYAEARRAYQATLVREPGRARSLFGAARAAELAGDRAGAKAGYRRFLALMRGGDGKRGELATARAGAR